jgi:hypothetical protein
MTWLVLLILFGIYQVRYVKSQEAYLTKHGFRVLAAAGRQLDAYVDSISKTVKTAEEQSQPQVYLQHFLPSFVLPDLCFGRESHDKGEAQKCPESDEIGANVFSLQFGSGPHMELRSFKGVRVSGRVRLDRGIRARLNLGEDDFDDILIANPRGEVLFQKAQGARIADLGHLTAGATSASQPAATAEPSGNPKPQATDEAASEKAHAVLSEFSNVLDVKVAGENYKLFVEPFRLSPGEALGEVLILCGLWRTERLDSESFALPYSYVIWFGLVGVAAGCFLWPFLKINYMSRTERLRQRDGWLLVFSIFLGATSVILAVLIGAYSWQVTSDIDDDLGALAKRIQGNVNTEIGRALGQLAALSAMPNVEELAAKPSFTPSLDILSHLGSGDLKTYPYFDFAFWADKTGWQRVKFTPDSMSTPQTRLATFRFFKDANDRDHLIARSQPCVSGSERATPERPGQVACPDSYSLEPTVSPNTGLFSTAVAAPYMKDRSPLTVQALVIGPMSLVNPVLAPNFGFAVLDRDGTVLFHSDASRNLSENFIDECKDPSAVQAALFSESPQSVDLVYSGKARRARLTKVTGLAPEPLTLVVFHNADLDRTVDMAIVLIVSVLMGLYALGILVGAFIDLVRGAPYPPRAVWPCSENSGRYALVVSVNGVLVLGFLVTYSLLWELSLLAVTAGIVLAGILATYGSMTMKRLPPLPLRWRQVVEPRFRIAYVAAGLSLLAITTIVPCFGFVKFAHDAANELATKHEQLSLLEALLDRDGRIRDPYHHPKAPEWIANDRVSEPLDRYDTLPLQPLCFEYRRDVRQARVIGPFDSASSPCASNTAGPSVDSTEPRSVGRGDDLHHRFDQALAWATRAFPANQLGREMRMLPFESSTASDTSVAKFYELGKRKFRVRIDGKGEVDATFDPWPGIGIGSAICLVLLMFLVGCWLTLLMKRIFLRNDQRLGPPDPVDWKTSRDITANALVLGEPERGTESPLAGIAEVDYVDFRAHGENPSLQRSSSKGVVVVDHFDFNMNNRRANLARLQLLERLLYTEGRRVVIGSSIDPVDYLSQGDVGILADHARAAAELLGRWTSVMSSFHPVVFKDRNRESFEKAFNKLNQDGAEPKLKQSARWIKDECDHTPYLREVGLRLFAELEAGKEYGPRQLGAEVMERADAYYASLWSTLTAGERLVLYQLSRDGWANPKNDRAIRQLLRKGIVHATPMRIMNESFRLFAVNAEDQKEVAEWERQRTQSSWRTVKFSFITAAVGLAAWLLYAQKDLFQSAIGYVVTLGAAVTAISNLLGGLIGRSGTVPKAPDAAA